MQRLLRTSGYASVCAATALNSVSARRFNATEAAASTSSASKVEAKAASSAPAEVAPSPLLKLDAAVPEAYRKVGNVLIITCADHPFKYSWEVARSLRDLRLEFRGQTVIYPDIPAVRLRLWRCRNVIRVDMVDTDTLKTMLGVPKHITFSDLSKQIRGHVGASNKAAGSTYNRTRIDFMNYRRQRIQDIMHRDQQELALLAEKKKLKAAQAEAQH